MGIMPHFRLMEPVSLQSTQVSENMENNSRTQASKPSVHPADDSALDDIYISPDERLAAYKYDKEPR